MIKEMLLIEFNFQESCQTYAKVKQLPFFVTSITTHPFLFFSFFRDSQFCTNTYLCIREIIRKHED
jgi:hypothetical protein